ncbi:MAG: NAD(P)/FAD-dependent oxidoreductase [Actinomycetota bacterium]
MSGTSGNQFDTVVIGGGQAGLITGYALQQHGVDSVILDAGARVGDAWRNRWDSLRLFTQAFMNGLPGMAFPGDENAFVSKDQVADFLEEYATAMKLRIRLNTRVERLSRDGDRFVIDAGGTTFTARNVIVAMADYQKPATPSFAQDLDPSIVQMHSSGYKSPGQLQDGSVLVVGLGNSGADIALEVAQTHETIVSGTESGSVPFKLEGWFGRTIGTRLVRFAMVRVLNTSTPIGRRARPNLMEKGPPLVRVRPKELAAAGVTRVDRTTGVEGGRPVVRDAQALDVSNVIWCTGYRPGFDWIDLPVFDDRHQPIHRRGIVADVPGLYFVGLFFLHAMWSETITGVQPDVQHVVNHLIERRARQPA